MVQDMKIAQFNPQFQWYMPRSVTKPDFEKIAIYGIFRAYFSKMVIYMGLCNELQHCAMSRKPLQ